MEHVAALTIFRDACLAVRQLARIAVDLVEGGHSVDQRQSLTHMDLLHIPDLSVYPVRHLLLEMVMFLFLRREKQ